MAGVAMTPDGFWSSKATLAHGSNVQRVHILFTVGKVEETCKTVSNMSQVKTPITNIQDQKTTCMRLIGLNGHLGIIQLQYSR